MKYSRFFVILGLLLLGLSLSSCSLPFVGDRKKAGLQVLSEPKATVFLDGQHVGQTPYFDEQLKAGEYHLKLVPEDQEGDFAPWESAVKLNPGILTVVNRRFGEEETSGYVLTLEPIAEKNEIRGSIISTPDSVVITVDGEPKGFTPLSLSGLTEGEHTITASAPGYQEETINAKTVKGHKLTINVQLAEEIGESPEASPAAEEEEEEEEEEKEREKKESKQPSSEPAPTTFEEKVEESTDSGEEMDRPYVKIKNTPTGWLNVRSEPSTAKGEETVLVKVDPGETYSFVEQNEAGWYKIEYEPGKQGWISGRYATLYR